MVSLLKTSKQFFCHVKFISLTIFTLNRLTCLTIMKLNVLKKILISKVARFSEILFLYTLQPFF